MTATLSDEQLAKLSAFATEVYGLRFPPDRWAELGRSFAAAALDLGIADLEGWVESLCSGARVPEQLTAIGNHLTISETYFFRQQEAFVALEREILPERLAERARQRRGLRLWSAGCASGEEPYSLAILLRHRFPQVSRETVTIFATDISTAVLARAEAGVYSEWSFRDAPEWLKPGFFKTRSAGKYELNPEIRSMVRFSALNLAAPLFPPQFGEHGDFDVILCRNVLMYFSAEWQDRIIRRFTAALAPNGWLIVGPCDVTSEEAQELRLHPTRPGLFRKGERPAAPVFTPVAPLPMPAVEPLHPPAAVVPPLEPLPAPSEPAEPLPAAPLAEVARQHADRGELAEALALCDEALANDSTNADLQHLRACVLMELNRVDDAETAFRRVLYLDPQAAMAEFALGSIAQRAGRTSEARHHYRLVLEMLSGHAVGEAVPRGDGMTVGRLRELVEHALEQHAA